MKNRAPRNRTLSCTTDELEKLSAQFLYLNKSTISSHISERVMCGDIFNIAPYLPNSFVDLLILDPPYNLSKNYNGLVFREKNKSDYQVWFESLVKIIKPFLTLNATIYVCSDWKTSALIHPVLEKNFEVRNRITWEREKGRGSKDNWKNNTEDIWYCTTSDNFYFDVEAVKLKKKVIAPYRLNGKPKDWCEELTGNYRLTHPSNLWSDITIPFWSMPENTDHPTQKPEKLIAKLILASSKQGDFVFDPFLGSGTTAAVATKLGRKWAGVDINKEYLCWTLKRVELAKRGKEIQGYSNGVFWERNSLSEQNKQPELASVKLQGLFDEV